MPGTPPPTRAELSILRAVCALGTAPSAEIAAAVAARHSAGGARVHVSRLAARGLLVRHAGSPPTYSSPHSLETLVEISMVAPLARKDY